MVSIESLTLSWVSMLPPFTVNRLRTELLRRGGARIGKGSLFWGVPTIVGQRGLQGLTIGDDCGLNLDCFFELEESITLEDHVAVGHEVMILTGGRHLGPAQNRAGVLKPAPVRIEAGAWLGARCTIMPGVTVGQGAVIGASTVIDKDVPKNTLVFGTQRVSLARWRV